MSCCARCYVATYCFLAFLPGEAAASRFLPMLVAGFFLASVGLGSFRSFLPFLVAAFFLAGFLLLLLQLLLLPLLPLLLLLMVLVLLHVVRVPLSLPTAGLLCTCHRWPREEHYLVSLGHLLQPHIDVSIMI